MPHTSSSMVVISNSWQPLIEELNPILRVVISSKVIGRNTVVRLENSRVNPYR